VPGHEYGLASRLLALTDRRLIVFRGNLLSRPKDLLFADPHERIVAVDYAPVPVGEIQWKSLIIRRDNGDVLEVTPWIGYEDDAMTIYNAFAPAQAT
jgi:hypothetical protein